MKLAIRPAATIAASIMFFAVLNGATAAEKPEYLQSFDPAHGFKPAQTDLTEIFLQIAGSLEYYGSPEPYLRHMQAERARIETKYQNRFGAAPRSFWPTYLTDAYIDRLAANWKALSPKLALEAIAKNTGNAMRDAINGTRGTGTTVVEIFNRHQARVFAAMAGKGTEPADFDALKTELITGLQLDKTYIHDEHVSMAQRDALDFTIGIRGPVLDLFRRLDAGLKPADAANIKAAITSVFIDVGRAAQSELETGIAERALDRQTAAK